jgi:hypothetical protein
MTWGWTAFLTALFIAEAALAFKFGLMVGHQRGYRQGHQQGAAWASRLAKHWADEKSDPTAVTSRR